MHRQAHKRTLSQHCASSVSRRCYLWIINLMSGLFEHGGAPQLSFRRRSRRLIFEGMALPQTNAQRGEQRPSLTQLSNRAIEQRNPKKGSTECQKAAAGTRGSHRTHANTAARPIAPPPALVSQPRQAQLRHAHSPRRPPAARSPCRPPAARFRQAQIQLRGAPLTASKLPLCARFQTFRAFVHFPTEKGQDFELSE